MGRFGNSRNGLLCSRRGGEYHCDANHQSPHRPAPLSVVSALGYNAAVTVPATSRQIRTFEDRAESLAHFFLRAGAAPRLVAYDDSLGCPLDQGLAAMEWTEAVGILEENDLIHAARLGSETAAAVVERKEGEQRSFIYFGPRMDAP